MEPNKTILLILGIITGLSAANVYNFHTFKSKVKYIQQDINDLIVDVNLNCYKPGVND